MQMKQRVYELLEGGNRTEPAQRLIDLFLSVLIVANVVAVALESVPAYGDRHAAGFLAFHVASVGLFILEYLVRLWVCTEHGPLSKLPPMAARRRYARSPFMVVDLVAIIGAVLPFLIGVDLRVLRIFRLVWLLKLVRYSPALISLGRALYDERHALAAVGVCMFGLLMLTASVMNLIEGEAQPEAFGSIPAAMWWSMATLSTVGYGDVVPVTPLGKVFGGLVTIMGIAMYALPLAIVANGFANQQTRRDFVITWGMLSRVPIFASLDPVSISKVAAILRARRYPAHYEIAHRGDPADCMYFVVSGELMVDTGERRAVLEEGEFVGEVALLHDTTRMAHIITLTECRLLLLMKHDFHGLLEAEPALRAALEAGGLARASQIDQSGRDGAGI